MDSESLAVLCNFIYYIHWPAVLLLLSDSMPRHWFARVPRNPRGDRESQVHTSSTTHQRTGRGWRHQSMLQCTWGHAWPLHQMVPERSGPCRYVMMQAGCKWERACVCVCMQERENVCMGARERVCIGVCARACWHERERHCHCFIKAIALFNGGRSIFKAFISNISNKQNVLSLFLTICPC